MAHHQSTPKRLLDLGATTDLTFPVSPRHSDQVKTATRSARWLHQNNHPTRAQRRGTDYRGPVNQPYRKEV